MEEIRTRHYSGRINMDSFIRILLSIFFMYCFFEGYLNQVIGSVMKYYIFLLSLLLIWKFHGKVSINFISKSYMIWFAYKIVTLLWTRSYHMFNLHILAHVGIILLITCVVAKPFDYKTIQYLTCALWAGSLAVGFLSLFNHGAYLGTFYERQVLILFGVSEDPNNQAAFLVFGIAIALYYIIAKKKYFVLGAATIFINMTSIMMTSSRGGFVTAALIAVMIVLFMSDSNKTKVWASIVIVLGVFFVLRYAGNFVTADSWDRLLIAQGYEGGSGRIDKWMNTIHLMNENPMYYLFGAGWGANWGYRGLDAGVHNTYLSHLCDTGIIGIVIFHYPIFRCITYLWKRKQFLPIIIAFCGLIPSLFLDSINKRYFWNSLLFLFMYYLYEREQSEDSNIIAI